MQENGRGRDGEYVLSSSSEADDDEEESEDGDEDEDEDDDSEEDSDDEDRSGGTVGTFRCSRYVARTKSASTNIGVGIGGFFLMASCRNIKQEVEMTSGVPRCYRHQHRHTSPIKPNLTRSSTSCYSRDDDFPSFIIHRTKSSSRPTAIGLSPPKNSHARLALPTPSSMARRPSASNMKYTNWTISTLFLLALLLLAPQHVQARKYTRAADAVRLQDVAALTFHDGKMTTGRRAAGVPQVCSECSFVSL